MVTITITFKENYGNVLGIFRLRPQNQGKQFTKTMAEVHDGIENLLGTTGSSALDHHG